MLCSSIPQAFAGCSRLWSAPHSPPQTGAVLTSRHAPRRIRYRAAHPKRSGDSASRFGVMIGQHESDTNRNRNCNTGTHLRLEKSGSAQIQRNQDVYAKCSEAVLETPSAVLVAGGDVSEGRGSRFTRGPCPPKDPT